MGPSTFFFLSLVLILGAKTESSGDPSLPTRLFVFGDSVVDTGNTPKLHSSSWKPPYGMTFPGKPAGRFSDGHVLTDFVASLLGIPSPIPYESRGSAGGNKKSFGMNFAYGGTGVLNTYSLLPNLTTQIDYLEQLLRQGAYGPLELSSSLALVSAASNDYAAYFVKNGSIEGLNGFSVKLVDQTALDLRRLTHLGLRKIAILGLEPMGCLPVVTQLSSFSSCVDLINVFATHHNSLLRTAVEAINHDHPASRIAILDLYAVFNAMVQRHTELGFVDPLKPCCQGVRSESIMTLCGTRGEHGNPLYEVCEKPSSSFFWDLGHPTQSGWSAVFPYFIPTIKQLLAFE